MARGLPSEPAEAPELRERLVAGGLKVLREHGPGELTMRQVAKAAGSTTMCLYTKFGGRTGLLEALYLRGFALLRGALEEVPHADDGTERILDLALAYRRFALSNPALYALMFERPLPDFAPSVHLRRDALNATFSLLVAAIQQAQEQGALPDGDPVRTSYLLWAGLHGMVSLELTHAVRDPLPDWILNDPGSHERALLDSLRALLHGLRVPATESKG